MDGDPVPRLVVRALPGAAFWDTEPYTSEVAHTWTLDNFEQILETPVYRDVAWRTISMAIYVTIADAVLAFPLAYYMARVASPRTRSLLVVAVLTPLWAGYLVKGYIWRTMLGERGRQLASRAFRAVGPRIHDGWALAHVHLSVAAVHDPPDLCRARAYPRLIARGFGGSRARSVRTFWKVTVPLVFPAIVAGSIFTFSLTLGDYILPGLIADEQFIGTVIYSDRGAALPVAAAYAMVPVAVMTAYLLIAKRLGAFENL